MKAKGSILAVVALALAAFAAEARAQPYGTITWGAGSPSTGFGSISGSGTYTVTTGWLPLNAAIVVVPGLGGVVAITPGANPVGGIWGPIKATGLAPGGYAIYVIITFKDGLGHQDIVCSPVNLLTVGAGPAAGPVPGTVQGIFTPGKGTVSANGTYTTNTGWTAKACGLNAVPMGGGEIPTSGVGAAPAGGKWGKVTITGLPAGSYLITGEVSYTNGTTTPVESQIAVESVM